MDNNRNGINVECENNNGAINVTQAGDIYSCNIEVKNNGNIVEELNDIQDIIDKNFSIRIHLHKEYLKVVDALSKSENVWWEADCEYVFEEWYGKIKILNQAIENALVKLNDLAIKLHEKCIEFKELDYQLFKLLERDKGTEYEYILESEGKKLHVSKDFLEQIYPENIECLEEKYHEILAVFKEKINNILK